MNIDRLLSEVGKKYGSRPFSNSREGERDEKGEEKVMDCNGEGVNNIQ